MSIAHEDVLNKMLMNECPIEIIQEDDGTETVTFSFEGHCVATNIMARRLGNGKYEILTFGFGG